MNNMDDNNTPKNDQYTCNDYRLEMRLLGIQQQLNNNKLPESDRKKFETERHLLEKEMDLL